MYELLPKKFTLTVIILPGLFKKLLGNKSLLKNFVIDVDTKKLLMAS